MVTIYYGILETLRCFMFAGGDILTRINTYFLIYTAMENLSPKHLSDLPKRETEKTTLEHIHFFSIEIAKNKNES